MDLLKALNHLSRVETAAADFYEFLSAHFESLPEVSGFYYRMAIQERNHRNLIGFCKKMVHQDPTAFNVVDFDVSLVEDFLEDVRRFKQENPRPSLSQALEFSISLENHGAEKIHKSLVGTSNPKISALITQLSEEDSRHAALLETFARDQLSRV